MLIFLSDGPSWIFLHLYFRNRKKKIHFFCIIRWFPQTALLPDVWLEQTYFFPIQTLLPEVVVAAQPKSKSSQLKYVFKSSSRVGGGIWSTEKPFIAKQVKYLASAKSPLSLSPISIIPHEYSPVPVSFMEIRKADYYFSKNSNLFLVKRRAADFSSNKK